MIIPDKAVEIGKGQRFSVVYEERTQDGKYVVGMNSYSKTDTKIYGVSVINKGESFLNIGSGWKDLVDEIDKLKIYNPDLAMDNFSIKVFSTDYPAEDSNYLMYAAIALCIIVAVVLGIVFIRRH